MANGAYRVRFPKLFGQWTGHDLADHGPDIGSFRPEFYERLRREDEPVLWRLIEENYLLMYEDFVRDGEAVEFEVPAFITGLTR